MAVELGDVIGQVGAGAYRLVKGKDVDITEATDGTAITLADADLFLIDDAAAGTQAATKKVTGAQLKTFIGAGITDGDKGDITVSSSGATWTIDADAVSYSKIQNVSATDRILGRDTAGAGVIEEITPANLRTMINVTDGANVNVSTNLSLGTVTATAMDVNSSDGTNATLTQADTNNAGLLSAAKWNEIVANTLKVTNATHTGEITGSTTLSLDVTAITNQNLTTDVQGSDELVISDGGTIAKMRASAFPISTATQTAIDAKQDTLTFGTSNTNALVLGEDLVNNDFLRASTGNSTIVGLSSSEAKSAIGVGNVDNTSDVDKPVSTATQTA